jgi:VCBS repeat-containing protein
MLDGAGASTFLDLIDERSQGDNSNKTTYDVKKFKEIKSEDGSKELPFTNVPRDQLKRKQIVFIDKQVPDYEKLAKSFRKNVEIHFIESNEDGFKKIEKTLENGKKYSAIHIIGHGSAGQILFGNALLTNESIENYKSTLSNIGESLTQKGDILFYGCNIAANDKGEALLKKISNITKADIAASNDLTGKGGDWVLENNYGIVETKNAEVIDYEHFLAYGVSSVSGHGVEKHSATNFKQSGQSDSSKRIMITNERQNISSANINSIRSNYRTSAFYSFGSVSSSNMINSYMVYLNDDTSGSHKTASFTFEGDILGYYFDAEKTIGHDYNWHSNSIFSKPGAIYQGQRTKAVTKGGRELEPGQQDKITISSDNKTLTMKARNGNPGDFIRVITSTPITNRDPITNGDSGSVNENYFITSQSLLDHSSDPDGDTLSVTSFDYVDDNGNTTSHTSAPDNQWKSVGTKYGVFKIYNYSQNILWQYQAAYPGSTNYDADMGSWLTREGATEAQWNNINALDPGENVTETINYTISDGNGGTATGTITITVTGQNDTPIADDDVNSVNENATISTRGNPTRDGVVANDTDVDGDDTVSTLTVNKIKAGYGEHLINRASPVMDPTNVVGNYGTLQMYSDGSYTYSANSEIAGLDEGESVNDIFTYAIKDNSNESELGNIGNTSDYVPDDKNSIGTLTITINGIGGGNNAPVATNDLDSVDEDATITRSSTASGTFNLVADDTDEDGDDISVVNVRVVSAPDPFSSPPDWNPVTADSNYGSNYREITGTYGTLRVGANGTYTYVADQDAADPLDPESPDFVYDEFEIQISDGEATSTSLLSIIVSGVNDDPVGVDNTDAVTYGSTLDRANGSVYDILTNDTDVDGDDNNSNFSVTSITATTASGSAQTTFTGNAETVTGHYGVLVLNSNGSYTYTPNDTTSRNLANGATGDDVFTYTVSDDSGGTDTTATLTITVTGKTPNPLNDTAYVAAGGSISVANDDSDGVDPGGDGINADGDHSGDVLENDSGTSNTVTAILSPTGETGTISTALSGNYGELTINADGSYTYEANNAAQLGATTATDVFTYTVTDATSGNTGTATITITILGSNDAPTTTDDTGYINENSTLTVDYDIEDENATDDESGTDSDYNNESGDHTGEVLLNDEDPEGATITVTAIRHSEDASTDATSITASTTYSNGSSILGDYGVLTIGADGSYTYNANTANALDDGDTATDVFTYTVSDGSLTATGTLTITIEGINDAPVAQDDFGFIDENETLTVGATADATTDNVYATNTGPITSGAISISNHSNASTTNGDTYSQDLDFNSDGTYTYVGGSRHGLVFKYGLTTAYDFSTIDTVAYNGSTNTDGYQKLDPDVGGVTGISAKPDGTKIFVTGTSGSDIIIKQFSLSTANNLATADTVAYDASSNADGYKEYTFSDFTSGNAQHSLIFSSDGTKLFTFEVASGNDKLHQYSLATAWDIGSMNHDGSITLQSDVYDPLGLTSDIDTPQGMAFNDDGTKLLILSDKSPGTDKLYQFSLNSAYNINDPVTLEGERSLSGTGNTRGLAFNSDGTELTILQHDGSKIDYHQLNLAGTAYEIGKYKETGTTGESTGNVIDTQSSTHYDNDVDDASSLTISAIRTGTEAAGTGTPGTIGSSLTGTYGTLTIQLTGAYEYVANLAATEALDAGDVAIDYFTYTLSDGTATDTAQLTIKVTGVNDAPSTENDTGYIAEGSTLTVADGDAAVSGTSTGSNSGDVLDNDTDVDITADSSGNVETNLSDDALTVTVGGTVSQNGGTDSSGDAVDANGQAATVGSAVTGLYGSLTINSNGSYDYVANNAEALDVGETVTDIFTFPVTDSQGSATTATLTITVIGVNDLPTSADATVYINENNIDASYSTRTSANITKTFASSDFAFTDADTSDSSISAIKIITLPSSGTLTLSGSAVTEDQEIAVG